MKNIFILSMLFISLSFYGQSVMASGSIYVGPASAPQNAVLSENFAVVTINLNNKNVRLSINNNASNYRIESSNLTDGGKTLKYNLSGGLKMTTALLTNIDIIMFPWDPSNSSVGFIKVNLTDDDKRLLGLNRN